MVLQASVSLGGILIGASTLLVGVMFSVVADFDICHPYLPCPGFLQKGQSGPHLHFSVWGLMPDCSLILGSSFKVGFGLEILVTFSLLFSVAK